jgi:hypothetical protein
MVRRNSAGFPTVPDGNTYDMPKVNPETGEPMSDAPEGDDVTRGGKERGDPALEGATESGRSGIGYSDTGSGAEGDTPDRRLQAEQGGAAGGGGQSGG